MASEILLVSHLHFDPTWRRCFDRPAKYKGVTVRSYAEVEELCINRFLKLVDRGVLFSEGQTAVWRKYLERNPRKLEALRKAVKSGALEVLYAGEVVSDTNLPTAEGLVRNFLISREIYEKLVDNDHAGLRMGWLEDAFGNSANYPQVLIGVGAEVACHTSYRFCPEDVWVGIDGTKIRCYDNHPAVRDGDFAKHPPCPKCGGRGCKTCGKTGMAVMEGFDPEIVRRNLKLAAEKPGDWVGVFLLAEEHLPGTEALEVIEEFNRDYAGKAHARLAHPSDLYKRYLPTIDAYLATRDDRPTIDLNPAMPGCMVTRIRCKQRTRSVAYELLAAEAALANESWKMGKPRALPANFLKAWQNLVFNQFHDAITGTHIDAAHVELMDMLDKAQKVALPYLPKSVKKKREVFKRIKGAGWKKLGNLNVKFDLNGIVQVLCNKKDNFGNFPAFSRFHRPVRVAELLLEPDFGDAWGQRISPFPEIDRESSTVLLGDYHTSVETSADSIRWTGVYDGGDWKIKKLKWMTTATASADGRRIDFSLEVDWDAGSRRIRVLVPVASKSPSATYEVPYGFVERSFDKTKLDYSQWRANTMEWPTLHWARAKGDEQSGVAVLNRGLPCYRWMPGRFDLSVLRSPEWAFAIVEPGNYEFWDTDGQRDAGKHTLEFSVWPYTDGLSEVELTRAGYVYNLPRSIDPPFKVLGDVVVTAWKPAQDGSGWILRLQDAGGRGSPVSIDFGVEMAVTVTDLLERPKGDSVRASLYETSLHRHGIHTLLIRPGL